jgi:hypothetical protein
MTGARRSENHRLRGTRSQEDFVNRGLDEERTRGPDDHRIRRPEDQGTKGPIPEDQRTIVKRTR